MAAELSEDVLAYLEAIATAWYDGPTDYDQEDSARIAAFDRKTCLALIAAARRCRELESESTSHKQARQMLADDLIALADGKDVKLELGAAVERRIKSLEAKLERLRADLATAVKCREAIEDESDRAQRMCLDVLSSDDVYGDDKDQAHHAVSHPVGLLVAEVKRLRADLAEAVGLLAPFAAWLGQYGEDNIAVDAVAAYRSAAAFVAKHKGKR